MTTNPNAHTVELYRSLEMPCPYLKEEQERKLFLQLEYDNKNLLSLLTRSGFRRSHDIVYTTDCVSCKACIPSRIKVRNFKLNAKSVAKVLNRNKHLTFKEKDLIKREEAYKLFQNYQNTRHATSDMRDMSFEEFESMFFESFDHSKLLGFYDTNNDLVACFLYDELLDGASAIYSFFDPCLSRQSLGKFVLYHLIKQLKEEIPSYLYLGYWIKNCPEMAYKGDFQAIEILKDNKWQSPT